MLYISRFIVPINPGLKPSVGVWHIRCIVVALPPVVFFIFKPNSVRHFNTISYWSDESWTHGWNLDKHSLGSASTKYMYRSTTANWSVWEQCAVELTIREYYLASVTSRKIVSRTQLTIIWINLSLDWANGKTHDLNLC